MGYSYSSSEVNWTIYTCPVTDSIGLQCYPRLLRTCGIPLAYSTSNRGLRRRWIKQYHPLYPTFVVYFKDYKPPLLPLCPEGLRPRSSFSISIIQRTYFSVEKLVAVPGVEPGISWVMSPEWYIRFTRPQCVFLYVLFQICFTKIKTFF